MGHPKLAGAIMIAEEKGKIVIGGDPEGLRSLAMLLTWLADADLEAWPYLPSGGRAHLHIYPVHDISANSTPAEILRLDAKGTGELPEDVGNVP
ncbi:MAG: hypothetical protein M0042_12495 [Nitrospiraceae bacterium]|nr:hypothetical protein [Nitrospiraceae bacterium]